MDCYDLGCGEDYTTVEIPLFVSSLQASAKRTCRLPSINASGRLPWYQNRTFNCLLGVNRQLTLSHHVTVLEKCRAIFVAWFNLLWRGFRTYNCGSFQLIHRYVINFRERVSSLFVLKRWNYMLQQTNVSHHSGYDSWANHDPSAMYVPDDSKVPTLTWPFRNVSKCSSNPYVRKSLPTRYICRIHRQHCFPTLDLSFRE